MPLSPMMQHYFSVKEKYKDCLLFYRLGDFYEMFFDDAVHVSELLGLTLTGRDCGLDERAPMCGVPFHAADAYIAKLVEAGERVAICEQIGEVPANSREMVKRDVVRVVTAGTVTDDGSLDENSNNYICATHKSGEVVAVSWADITTGELCVTDFTGKNCVKEAVSLMTRLCVREIVSDDEMIFAAKDLPEALKSGLPRFSSYLGWTFAYAGAEKRLCEQLKVSSLTAFSIDGRKECICAVGALLEYLKETQKHALLNIDNVKYVNASSNMQLDSVAIRNLEIVKNLSEGKRYGSLLWLLDKTCTPMGARLLSNIITAPICDKSAINYRLDGVEELFNSTVVRVGVREVLKQIKDIERLTGKISNDAIMPDHCLALARSLLLVPSLRFRLTGFSSKILNDISDRLYDLSEVADKLNAAIVDENTPTALKEGGFIKEGYNARLDELRAMRSSVSRLIAEMEVKERDSTGIRTLKIRYNRVFGYYIEVSKSFKDKVPTHYIRRQTLANAERYITEELKELEERILSSDEAAMRLELSLYSELKEMLSGCINRLKCISESIARLDVLSAFAEIAKNNKYVRPKIVDSSMPMIIKDGRHPVVESISKEKFVPNDTLLDEDENRTMIITGPNMAGKSTYMRQNALIAIMAHIGSFVPAASAQIPLIDRVYTRVGASDNLIYDQSTFMVEMIEVATILQNATKNSLLLLDEVGRGTSTYDGLSIAWAVIEQITQKIGAKTLFATHYHELLELENNMRGVKNYKVAVKEFGGNVIFLRKILRGGANRSFGIEVAALAGVPSAVTDRAKAILKSIENGEIEFKKIAESEEEEKKESEIERILKDINLDNVSPMQAMMILGDLIDKVKKNG